MDKKRLLFGIGFLILCLLLGFALYWVFFHKKAPGILPRPTAVQPRAGQFPQSGTGAGQQPAVTPPGALPPTRTVVQPQVAAQPAAPRVKPVLTEALTSPAPEIAGGGARFYNQSDGKFYRVGADGRVAAMSDQVFFNVQKATWSQKNNESILEYPDGNNIYYNFDTKKQATLPKHWENFSFAPTGDQIAAKSMGLATENRWLITANPDGSGTTLVEPMGENADKVMVDWSPNKQVVALSRTGEPLGADREEVLFIGLHGENFRSTVVEGRGLKSAWSPAGNRLLYSVYSSRSDFKPELWVVDASGDQIGNNRKYLNLNTWADKCAFATERYLYCGVPQTLDTGAGFAPQLADNTPDQIMKIDLQTGARTMIPTTDNYVVDHVFVGSDGQTLYFTDKRKTGLFSAPL